MTYKWFPWRWIIRKAARRHGFLDPMVVWSYLQNFAQPSEVAGPIELIRDSAVFHARGLINSRAIPQNSDWVWPYWICRQFNPADNAFIPRAFSLTYINLTERNWTAVGRPGCAHLPIVDAAGLVTPHWDGWSLDWWLVDPDGRVQTAARGDGRVRQRLFYGDNLSVVTRFDAGGDRLWSTVRVETDGPVPHCRIGLRWHGDGRRRLAVSLRPYNPEGVSFIHRIALNPERTEWTVNGTDRVMFDRPMETHRLKHYRDGDVANGLAEPEQADHIACPVGMATAAALFSPEGPDGRVELTVPLDRAGRSRHTHDKPPAVHPSTSWRRCMDGHCVIEIPDKQKQLLYERALRSVVLHTIGSDVYPGPFTYKRFWFRDASFILSALLCGNLARLAEPVLASYPGRQKANGYFQSQYGEWDSNGQVLWIFYRYWKMTGAPLEAARLRAVEKAADWIVRHCAADDGESLHAGLLPAGFSAEHFGPNDHYYWDDFWAAAGLDCAAAMLAAGGRDDAAARLTDRRRRLGAAIDRSLERVAAKLKTPAMPVSPYRRLDSGAIGSVVAGYPLQVMAARDARLLATADYLMDHCRFKQGFFLDISHSGINPYLTLHLAQVLMRAGDRRHLELAAALCRLATSTGQWPEAIHPRTNGGCMGDGQHIWAAAEWVNYLRNGLVYEEATPPQLVLGAGIDPAWLRPGRTIRIGPAPTLWGPVSVRFDIRDDGLDVHCDGQWHAAAPAVIAAVPGYRPQRFPDGAAVVRLEQKGGTDPA